MAINSDELSTFKSLELLAKKVVEGFITGLHKSPFHGFSVEFAEHRLYNTGQSTRHIDWKLFARTDKLFIKRYEEETNLRCQLVIDTSSSMLFPKEAKTNKLQFSVYAAAALCELLKQQRDAFGLTLFENTIHKHLSAKGSPMQQKLVLNELSALLTHQNQQVQTSAASAINQIAEIIHQRSLVVFFSDMFESHANEEELFSALQHLKYRKHEVVLFHVVHKGQELDFDFENRPHHFIDIETGEEIKLNPNELKDSYVNNMHSFIASLGQKCGLYGIDFVEADISEGFDKVLLTYLLKRQKMMT
jgi:uncharacterized protein (DUF58 family)